MAMIYRAFLEGTDELIGEINDKSGIPLEVNRKFDLTVKGRDSLYTVVEAGPKYLIGDRLIQDVRVKKV